MASVAFFGPSGTFTEMALERILGRADHLGEALADQVGRVSATSPAKVIDLVRTGSADFGCVPMESSIEGSVPATMDALAGGVPVQIYAEDVLDVSFTIAARCAMDPDRVETIAAYPVAARQVARSVAELFPNARLVTADSNAAAADDVVNIRADAAVTTQLAAQSNGLTVLADKVVDIDSATTRFVLLGRPGPIPDRTGTDRTAVILDLPNAPGALMKAMDEFASREIDLTRIESRPQKDRPGEYFFHLDAVGHLDDAAVAEALAGLHRRARSVTYLGSWPAVSVAGSPPPDYGASRAWVDGLHRGER